MNINKFILLGTENLSFSATNKVKLTNIISVFTILISTFYTFYFISIEQSIVTLINIGFIIAYSFTIVLNKFGAIKEAKMSFFCVLMLHLIVTTNLYLTNASGFHHFYFLVPAGAFLLLELDEKVEKFLLSFAAIVLFFYCENTLNTSPLIVVSDEHNRFMFQSVILVALLELIVVLILFTAEIEKNEKALTIQATTDTLTGIANRHLFFTQGHKMLRQAILQNRHFSLLIIDLDSFKYINDHFGHAAGDKCLIDVTNLIKASCRSSDLFARVGGEEFSVLLPDTTILEANNIAEKIRVAMDEHHFTLEDGTPITMTCSIGVSVKANENNELKDILSYADKALFQAKAQGRNRVAIYHENEPAKV